MVGGHDGDRVTAPTAPSGMRPGSPDPQPRPPAPAGADGGSGAADGGGAGRPPYRPRHVDGRTWWWRWGFVAALVLLTLAFPVLVVVGARTVLDSSDGRVIRTESDPTAPGFEALVEPTPTQALAVLAEDGSLDSVAVLVLSSDTRGAVVVAPGATLTEGPGGETLASAHAVGGLEAVRDRLEQVVGVGIPAIDQVTPGRWADLVAPVAPLRFDNPRSLSTEAVEVGAGAVELQPSQVWGFLSGVQEGEGELERMIRVETFWQAWLEAVGGAGDVAAVVPGEVDVGLGRFVRGLGGDQVEATLLPVAAQPTAGATVYAPLPEEVAALVARIVPFPAGPEGARIRLVVLDGTGQLDHGARAAVTLGAAGGQVDVVGNAASFGVAETQLVYHDPSARPQVERLREALGVGVLVEELQPDALTGAQVILGEDYLAAHGG
jgi:hypothetical protein